MGVNLLKAFVIAGASLFISMPSVHAEAKNLIYQGGRRGVTWDIYLINKKLVKLIKEGDQTQKLYLVYLKTKFSNQNSASNETKLIQCSTTEPFVASSGSDSKVAQVRYLDPVVEHSNNIGELESRYEYWPVCHDINLMNSSNIENIAKQLGYTVKITPYTKEIPYGLMEYIK